MAQPSKATLQQHTHTSVQLTLRMKRWQRQHQTRRQRPCLCSSRRPPRCGLLFGLFSKVQLNFKRYWRKGERRDTHTKVLKHVCMLASWSTHAQHTGAPCLWSPNPANQAAHMYMQLTLPAAAFGSPGLQPCRSFMCAAVQISYVCSCASSHVQQHPHISSCWTLWKHTWDRICTQRIHTPTAAAAVPAHYNAARDTTSLLLLLLQSLHVTMLHIKMLCSRYSPCTWQCCA